VSASVLSKWVANAESSLGTERAGRLGWLVATTVVSAILQQVVDNDGRSRFLLKGGTMLQYRLGPVARATKDLDGIVRGDLDEFVGQMDERLGTQWGPIGFPVATPRQ
jgi:predicted nucleotidyltransferase component of viral defense system